MDITHVWKFSESLEGVYCTFCGTTLDPWEEAVRKGWFDLNAVPPAVGWDSEEHRNLTYLLDECPARFANPKTDKPKGASYVSECEARPAQLELNLMFT